MKIARFINGKKYNQEFSEELIIDNDVIQKTIEKTNARLIRKDKKING